MVYQAQQYFKFLYNASKSKHRNNAFINALVNNCFKNNNYYPEFSTLKDYKTQLLQNKNTIKVTDFGAGSRVFKSNEREVFKIAKTAGITTKRAQTLFKIVKFLNVNNSLELGTSLGIGTTAISLANSQGKVTTIEGCPETAKVALQQFNKFNLKNIDLKVDTIENQIQQLQHNNFDLIYFDGNHQKQATLNYFNQLLPTVNENSILIFDDIHWSKSMTEAWNTIKQHPKVTYTIDTFFWGLVGFKSEALKTHHTIKL